MSNINFNTKNCNKRQDKHLYNFNKNRRHYRQINVY